MSDDASSHTSWIGFSREQSLNLYDGTVLPERTIRILILQPGPREAPIHCTLDKGHLSELAGKYEALSYAWGEEVASEMITCNGMKLCIRPNLAAALRQLRHLQLARRLWVDFLCINQANTSERGNQVACMFDVYAQSERVLLWLGEAAPGSDLVMEYIAELDAVAEVTEHVRWRSRQRVFQPRPHALDHEPPKVPNGMSWPQVVGAFLARPWFRRFWVQQEAAACPQTVVLCGSARADWDNLFAFAWRMMRGRGQFTPLLARKLRAIPREGVISLRLIRLIHINRHIHSEDRKRSKASLLYVLNAARGCEATDPRDRIYAVQHLARQGSSTAVLLTPNYDISMMELCTRFAVQYIKQRGLAILAFAGRAAQHSSRAAALPSWAPDWENPARHHFMGSSHERAGGRRPALSRVDHDPTSSHHFLVVRGLIFGTLNFLSGTIDDSIHADDYDELQERQRLPALALQEKATYDFLVGSRAEARYRGGKETLYQAYARTIMADSLQNLPGSAPLRNQCAKWRRSLQLALCPEPIDPDIDRGMVGSLGDLQLREDRLQRTDSMPSVDSLEDAELDALSFAEAGDDMETDPQAALASSAYALNVHKTGTYIRMQVARTAKGGWLALVPKTTQAGDQLCIVQGFGRGLVVRNVSDPVDGARERDAAEGGPQVKGSVRRPCYEIIGECYIHGAMRGEMAPEADDAKRARSSWRELEFT